jgi:hypothetical protein
MTSTPIGTQTLGPPTGNVVVATGQFAGFDRDEDD